MKHSKFDSSVIKKHLTDAVILINISTQLFEDSLEKYSTFFSINTDEMFIQNNSILEELNIKRIFVPNLYIIPINRIIYRSKIEAEKALCLSLINNVDFKLALNDTDKKLENAKIDHIQTI